MQINKHKNPNNEIIRIQNLLQEYITKIHNNNFLPIRIKDYVRRYIFSNRNLGRYVPYKDSQGWHPDINGKGFGKVIGVGSEHTVYENLDNSNEVLKMLDIGYPTKQALRAGVKQHNKRNLIPLQERAKFIGYVKGPNNAGTQEAYYPIFRQKKLILPDESMYGDWLLKYLPRIENIMETYGITKSSRGWNEYQYKDYKIGDLSPDNIGFDSNNNIRFFDLDVYRNGGLLLKQSLVRESS